MVTDVSICSNTDQDLQYDLMKMTFFLCSLHPQSNVSFIWMKTLENFHLRSIIIPDHGLEMLLGL